MATEFFITVLKVIIILNLALTTASLCTWFERKCSALIQDRVGANRAGAFFYTDKWWLKPAVMVIRVLGVLGLVNTLFCDSLKGLWKEDFTPAGASKFLHSLAPFLACFPVFMAFAVLPFAPDFEIFGMRIRPQVASIDAGLLFVLAMGSIAVYGVAIAGFSGLSKYSLMGSLRAAAQMVSYELAMGLAIVTMVLVYGTLDVYRMVELQQGTWYGVLPKWGIFQQPLAFLILMVVGMAETKRAPFDLPEAESELVAGYLTEYSGMKFLLFWLGEFAEIALFSMVLALIFFGGWDLPFVKFEPLSWWGALAGHLVLVAKMLIFCILQIVIRWTLPRFRYDQLMNLGWKMMLPLSLANLFGSAAFKVFVR